MGIEKRDAVLLSELIELHPADIAEVPVVEHDDGNRKVVFPRRRQLLQVPAEPTVTIDADDHSPIAAEGRTECRWKSVAKGALIAGRDECIRMIDGIGDPGEVADLGQLADQNSVVRNRAPQRPQPGPLRLDLAHLLGGPFANRFQIYF